MQILEMESRVYFCHQWLCQIKKLHFCHSSVLIKQGANICPTYCDFSGAQISNACGKYQKNIFVDRDMYVQ